MSYDVTLEVDAGGPEPVEAWWGNYTSNCAPMWRKAGADLEEMHGKTAKDVAPVLEAAIQAMESDPDAYAAMNPANGWGDHISVREFLERFAVACRKYPKAKVSISL